MFPHFFKDDFERPDFQFRTLPTLPVNDTTADRKTFSTLNVVFFLLLAGIVLSFLLPAILQENEYQRKQHCAFNLRTIGLGIQNYLDQNGVLPPIYTVDNNGQPLHSWRVLLLPFLGEEELKLFYRIRLEEPWNSPANRQFHNLMPRCFFCPSAPITELQNGLTRYRIPYTKGQKEDRSAFGPPDRLTKLTDILDGSSNTLAVLETNRPICWMDPQNELILDEFDNTKSLSQSLNNLHQNGINILLLDGNVIFSSPKVDSEILKRKILLKDSPQSTKSSQ